MLSAHFLQWSWHTSDEPFWQRIKTPVNEFSYFFPKSKHTKGTQETSKGMQTLFLESISVSISITLSIWLLDSIYIYIYICVCVCVCLCVCVFACMCVCIVPTWVPSGRPNATRMSSWCQCHITLSRLVSYWPLLVALNKYHWCLLVNRYISYLTIHLLLINWRKHGQLTSDAFEYNKQRNNYIDYRYSHPGK